MILQVVTWVHRVTSHRAIWYARHLLHLLHLQLDRIHLDFSRPDCSSGLDRSRGLDRCRGVDCSHLHQGPRLPLHGVRLLAFLDFVFGIVALTQMPPSTHASDSSEDDDPDEVRYDRYHRMIIRPEGNGFIPNHHVIKIITDILGGLYNAHYPTWSDFTEDLVQQMFNQFKVLIQFLSI
nr:uncharacterized protein LOC108943810 [Nicotiana tomentosiformis]